MYHCKNLNKSQIAPANFVYRKFSLDYALDSFERLGARRIEFYAAAPHFCLEDIQAPDMHLLAKKLRAHHLMVDSFCPENCFYPVNIASSDYATRTRSIEYYLKGIQTAVEIECPHCQFLPGYALFDEPAEEAWKRGCDSMAYLADVAASYGIDIAIEPSPSYWAIIDSTKKGAQMLKEINSPGLTGLIDTVCVQMMGETIEQAIAEYGIENVKHVHFSDAVDLENTNDWSNRALGKGTMDMERFVRAFDEAGYTGTFGLELFGGAYEYDPEPWMQHQIKWCEERFA